MFKPQMVIFDWNGTLIDDVWLSVNAINQMLEKRQMPLTTIDYYKEIFDFPVKKYYQALGLDTDKEWDNIANEFIAGYLENLEKIKLFQDVTETIGFLKLNGIETGILSAMQHEGLNRHVKHLKIDHFFKFIQGIENYYAEGKSHLGKKLLADTGLKGENILFVGDTTHDFEVSKEIGCHTVLVSRGHNSTERLDSTGAVVINSLAELKNLIDL
ncbi:MAG TPA: HAD family hydrolase [bacterium]|nr:HAD family hydrolase [bacterium]HPS29639.1 HAD family hydrolase [bacterium]